MCLSCAEGGRRCRDPRRLKKLSVGDLAPASVDGRPDVAWSALGAEVAPAALWDAHPPAVAAEAVAVIAEARAVEEEITADFLAALPRGTYPHGLEFRMKSPSSLARKLETKARAGLGDPNEPQSLQRASDKLTDILRYTAVTSDHDQVAKTVKSTIARLRKTGYSVVEAEHSYVTENPYKGVHILVRRGDERPIELQFHSTLSQRIKDANHVDYETERDLSVPYADRAAARNRMIDRSNQIPAPAGLERLKTIGGVPLTVKTYPNPYKMTDTEERGGDLR
jgi:hypothetical protein